MKQLVCLSHTPWRPSPTRNQQLLTRLKGVNILFFEPSTTQRSRSSSKFPGRRVRPNITVYTLPPGPNSLLESKFFWRHNPVRMSRFLSKVMQNHDFHEPTLWLTSPEYYALPQRIPHRGLIYDCSLEWDELPLEWESELALHADVVFAASPGLAQRLSPCCDNIAIIPNGVNYALFARHDLSPPPLLRQRQGPILGRVGAVTSQLELTPLLAAAAAQPEWTFLLIGEVEKGPKQLLSPYPNILLTGQVPMVDVPDWLSSCHLCFDLLTRDGRGCDILPSRLYEYLAVGMPVVLMIIPDQVEPLPDVVYTATDSASFLLRCQRALIENPSWVRERRRAYAQKSQWTHRASEIQHILETTALF